MRLPLKDKAGWRGTLCGVPRLGSELAQQFVHGVLAWPPVGVGTADVTSFGGPQSLSPQDRKGNFKFPSKKANL